MASPHELDALAQTVVVPTGKVKGLEMVVPKLVRLYVTLGERVPVDVILEPNKTLELQVPAALLKGPKLVAEIVGLILYVTLVVDSAKSPPVLVQFVPFFALTVIEKSVKAFAEGKVKVRVVFKVVELVDVNVMDGEIVAVTDVGKILVIQKFGVMAEFGLGLLVFPVTDIGKVIVLDVGSIQL
jgi:hypothetical protein